jgi:hypothetical protein
VARPSRRSNTSRCISSGVKDLFFLACEPGYLQHARPVDHHRARRPLTDPRLGGWLCDPTGPEIVARPSLCFPGFLVSWLSTRALLKGTLAQPSSLALHIHKPPCPLSLGHSLPLRTGRWPASPSHPLNSPSSTGTHDDGRKSAWLPCPFHAPARVLTPARLSSRRHVGTGAQQAPAGAQREGAAGSRAKRARQQLLCRLSSPQSMYVRN